MSYPSIISLEVIIAGALNFKMAPLHFVYFTQELINAMEKKIQFERAQNMLLRFASHFSKKDVKVFLAELVNLLISGGSLRLMLMPLIPKITMEWFQE